MTDETLLASMREVARTEPPAVARAYLRGVVDGRDLEHDDELYLDLHNAHDSGVSDRRAW